MIVRPERDGDTLAIRHVLIAAFGRTAEADLVERLRRDGDLILSLVADDGDVRSYAGFPRLSVEDASGTHPAAGLAPVAVVPDLQRRGIGSVLIRAGLRMLADKGVSLAFVLGDPAYYTRFGYSVSAADPFASAYSGPHFMAVQLNADAPQGGIVHYPAAFVVRA